MRFLCDIECDGFVPRLLHSLVIVNVDSGEMFSCADQKGYPPIALGLELLAHATEVIGHNIIAFDLRIIKKLHGLDFPREIVTDTLVQSRVLWPDLRASDQQIEGMPPRLHSKHSLEAWGWRLGQRKTDFSKDFRFWSKTMQDYCEDDVVTTAALWLRIQAMESGS